MLAGTSPLEVVIWIVGAMALGYIARDPAHRAIRGVSRILHNAMRVAAHGLLRGVDAMKRRNREVLLSEGMLDVERALGREFERVSTTVQRDLSRFPALRRRLDEEITRIDEDYRQSAEVPPRPPEWVHAVDVVANIETKDTHVVGKILSDIHGTLKRSAEDATGAWREAMAERHKRLDKMAPHWRNLEKTVDHLSKQITGLEERSAHIDEQMSRYEEIRARTEKSERLLSSSSLVQFAIAAFVMAIAAMGAFINFNLIALPMSEMVGGGSYIGPVRTSDVAALVIILIELSMGIFLLESLRITHLFPIIGNMDDKMRKRMVWVTFALLFILASIEASLAYMRDLLAADREALAAQLAGEAVASAEFRWIPSIGQMVMGFVLPFALAFVAIPLESFVHSSRTVLGMVATALLQGLAFVCRLLGNLSLSLGRAIEALYDLAIFAPLKIEQWVARARGRHQGGPPERDDHRAVGKSFPGSGGGAAVATGPGAMAFGAIESDDAEEGK